MVCYICGSNLDVINSRPQRKLNQVWRRRVCRFCDVAYTTTETIDYAKSLRVAKLVRGRRQLAPLERDRLFLSLHRSLAHRPTALTDAGGLTATILAKLAPQATNGLLTTEQIIQTSLVALTRFDKLAAQHYAALHKR